MFTTQNFIYPSYLNIFYNTVTYYFVTKVEAVVTTWSYYLQTPNPLVSLFMQYSPSSY